MKTSPFRSLMLLSLLLCVWLPAGGLYAFDRASYEEPAGTSFAVLLNPGEGSYGISLGHGTWLRGVPVFGDYSGGILYSGIEKAWYSGIGMTIRIMPRWTATPFIGAGGTYHYALSPIDSFEDDREYRNQGRSYWGGHVEGGIRIWLNNRIGLFEVCGRYTWTSFSESERDYWLIGISTGTGY